MSVTPPENPVGAPSARVSPLAFVVNRVRTDKDVHAGLSTLKRVFIQVFVSLLSFVMATAAAYLVEEWLHFIETEMENHEIAIAPFFKVALPYVSGFLLMGLAIIAMVLAFREAWHIGGHHSGGETEKKEQVDASGDKAPPTPISKTQRPGSGNRAERRRQNRH